MTVNCCPECGSHDIEEHIEEQEDGESLLVFCHDCNAYTLKRKT